MGLHHTANLQDALSLGGELERLAYQLRDKVERILRDTAYEKQSAQDLLARAERIR